LLKNVTFDVDVAIGQHGETMGVALGVECVAFVGGPWTAGMLC
jgi:hypothetical protein